MLDAAWQTTDDKRFDYLITWAREIIAPLADSGYPPALWLKCSLPYGSNLGQKAVERLHREQIEKAAAAGDVEAKFSLGIELDRESTSKESAALFKEAAESGHAYAMWCHGLNLLSGRGIEKNESEGVSYIAKSAELKFEGAITFVANAFANGTHGYQKDEKASAMWWKKLSDPGVINY